MYPTLPYYPPFDLINNYNPDITLYLPEQLIAFSWWELQNILSYSKDQYLSITLQDDVSSLYLLNTLLTKPQLTAIYNNPNARVSSELSQFLAGYTNVLSKVLEYKTVTKPWERFDATYNIAFDDQLDPGETFLLTNYIVSSEGRTETSGFNEIDVSNNIIPFPNCVSFNFNIITMSAISLSIDDPGYTSFKSFPFRVSTLVYNGVPFDYTMCFGSAALSQFTEGETYRMTLGSSTTLISTAVCQYVSNVEGSVIDNSVLLPFTDISFATSGPKVFRLRNTSNVIVRSGFFFLSAPFHCGRYQVVITDSDNNDVVAMTAIITVQNSFVTHFFDTANPTVDILAQTGVLGEDNIWTNDVFPGFSNGGCNILSFPYFATVYSDTSPYFNVYETGVVSGDYPQSLVNTYNVGFQVIAI